MKLLAPSILAADFSCLGKQISQVEQAGADYLHIDVMDGLFVPSISFGMPVIQSIRNCTELTFDVHLMVDEPIRYLKEFVSAGADLITVHAEACTHLDRTLMQVKEFGKKAAVALNPATGLDCIDYILPELDMVLLMTVNPGFGGQKFIGYSIEKIKALRKRIEERGLSVDIEVDGGITPDNIEEVALAGANVIVAGSAVFKGDAAANVKALKLKLCGFPIG